MPRFLAVYTMKPEDLASFRNLPKAEQDAVDAVGIKDVVGVGRKKCCVHP